MDYTKINLGVAAIGLLILLAMAVLSGCATAQPPGQDLWLTIQ